MISSPYTTSLVLFVLFSWSNIVFLTHTSWIGTVQIVFTFFCQKICHTRKSPISTFILWRNVKEPTIGNALAPSSSSSFCGLSLRSKLQGNGEALFPSKIGRFKCGPPKHNKFVYSKSICSFESIKINEWASSTVHAATSVIKIMT